MLCSAERGEAFYFSEAALSRATLMQTGAVIALARCVAIVHHRRP